MIHCRRNYQKCPDCDKPIQKSSLDSHISEFHTSRPCPHCGLSLLPSFLSNHDCPNQPKVCKFCEGKYPSDQYNEHFYQCSSRTEQCPRCSKYIQIRDYDHHVAEVDCLGTRDSDSERLQKITNDVMAEFSDQPGFDFETEIVRRLAEDQDREYAEALYHKLMMERSPSHDSQIEEAKSDLRAETSVQDSPGISAPLPGLDHGVSESSWGALTDEEQLMNEIILKSLQEK